MTKLTKLDLADTSFSDATPLAGLTELRNLVLAYSGVRSFEWISELKALESLEVSGTGLTELSKFSGFTKLTQFFAFNNAITSVEPLSGLVGVTYLGLARNKIPISRRSRPS
ncbi:MAG: hypothetical protein QM756_35335 [Polyangiaceae bacterium]